MKDHVDQIMTKKLITVGLTDSVRKAYQVMEEGRIRHLPVIDESGTILGILSDRDLQRAMKPQKSSSMSEGPIIEFDSKFLARDFMTWPVKTISVSSTLIEVSELMLKEKMSALLVVGPDKLPRGIVTTDDLLKLLISILKKDPSQLQLKLETLFSDFFQPNYAV